MGALFLHLACQGAVRTPTPVSYATEKLSLRIAVTIVVTILAHAGI